MSEIIEISNQEFVVIESDDGLEIISEAIQGPQGIQGPKGDKGEPGGATFERIAAVALGGHRVVLIDSQGKADYASNDTQAHASRIVGMTTGAADSGATTVIQSYGEITEPSWNWNTSLPVYLGTNGLLTQVAPTAPSAKFSVVIGFPISSTTLFVNIGIPITLVA